MRIVYDVCRTCGKPFMRRPRQRSKYSCPERQAIETFLGDFNFILDVSELRPLFYAL